MRKICYYPELVTITGSVTAAVMMSQLEFWFKVTGGKSFYKFMEPCDHGYYKEGDSWQEELMMSSSEIRTAFKRIGIAYKSKKEFMEHERDIFQGKMYASYYDRIRKMTFYFRNAGKVKEIFDQFDRNEDKQVIEEKVVDGSQLEPEIKSDDLEKDGQNVWDNSNQAGSRNEQTEDGLLYIKDNRLNNKQDIKDYSLKDINNKQNIKDYRQESNKELDIPYTEICKLYNEHLGDVLGRKDGLEIYEKAFVKRLWIQSGKRLVDFKNGFMKVAKSSFLCGRIPNKPFRATLAWILKGDHFIRILAGDYDDFKARTSLVKVMDEVKDEGKAKVEDKTMVEGDINALSKGQNLGTVRRMPNKVQRFIEMDSRDWDFDEIERLERAYIDQKIASMQQRTECLV